jgi:parallel beta-helix repeat protein
MNNKLWTTWTLALLSTFTSQLSTSFAQGSLAPPGAPAPTMKSLVQIEPRTPISSLPFSITNAGAYYLTTNLVGVTNANGITISASHITLDLNGFALLAVPGSTAIQSGIYVAGTYTNLTVRNGTVSGWFGSGVDAYSGGASRNVAIERLTVSANLAGYGIAVQAGSAVRDCLAQNNATGILAYGALVSGCAARDNTEVGIEAHDSQVRGCRTEANGGDGIAAYSSAVLDCFALSNRTDGIYLGASGCQIIGNICSGNNTAGAAAGSGIYVDFFSSHNRIEANHLTANTSAGITIVTGSTNNFIVQNTVSGNGLGNYGTIPAGNAFGPIVTATGMITNNGWANFSY